MEHLSLEEAAVLGSLEGKTKLLREENLPLESLITTSLEITKQRDILPVPPHIPTTQEKVRKFAGLGEEKIILKKQVLAGQGKLR